MTRNVLAYWSVRELGISGTSSGKKLGISQSVVSPAKIGGIRRGKKLVKEHRLTLIDNRNA